MAGEVPHSRYRLIRNKCLEKRTLFTDPEFQPNKTSLYGHNLPSGLLSIDIQSIQWKRPKEIVRNPKFVVDDIRRHDLDQGRIGDCWFIAAAAVICSPQNRPILKRVIPLDQSFDEQYAGIFRFHFWWYGEWTEVIVDDFLPTDGQQLVFCTNREHPDEFWCALLEKAYAKLRGSYAALVGGNIENALVDLTGGISEEINIQNKHAVPQNLFQLLRQSLAMNTMIGASIRKQKQTSLFEKKLDNGLVAGHAYSITAIKQINSNWGTEHLIRLRNPWGKSEWHGRWSDSSPEMHTLSPRIRQQLKFIVRDDGEFWMSFKDVVSNFDDIQLCHLHPDSFSGELEENSETTQWKVHVHHGEWIKGTTAGGCGNSDLLWINPQYFVTLRKDDDTNNDGSVTLIVSLMIKGRNRHSETIAIGFNICKLTESRIDKWRRERVTPDQVDIIDNSGNYKYDREVTRRFEYPPGIYVIIPTTFKPNEEAKFLLRVYTETQSESRPITSTERPILTPVEPLLDRKEDIIAELFHRYCGKDKRLDNKEVKALILELSDKELGKTLKFNSEACRSLIACMDKERSGTLNLEETRKMWWDLKIFVDLFSRSDSDKSERVNGSELKHMFTSRGFRISERLLEGVLIRYGGRRRSLTLNNFIIVVCKLIVMYDVFQEHKDKRGSVKEFSDATEMTMDEFLYCSFLC